jgi:cholesterol transport system auxiliary component
MRRLTTVAAMLLAGCMGNPVYQSEARFDLGLPTTTQGVDNGLSGVDVATPSWLDGGAMQYRLLYVDSARRREYAESRWAAPPAELLRQALDRTLAPTAAGRCRLRIELDEFVQVFDTPASSRFVLEGRATLFAGQNVLGSRGFNLSEVAPMANAKGGVAAASAATRALGDELTPWLGGQAGHCRSS